MKNCDRRPQILLALAGAVALGGAVYHWNKLKRKLRLGAAIWSRTWFSEFSCMWPGQAFSLRVEQELFDGKSDFQDIKVYYCGKDWGNVLVLDGVIQVTQKDECSYQEMMAHVPAMSHPCPLKALVIGGGDGGVLRELAKHPSIQELHICEIDKKVIEVSKQFLPTLACGYNDPRVQVHIKDGFVFMQEHKNEFDVIVCDSSDPVGPAEVLFKEPFYRAAYEALTPQGILCAQGECIWLHLNVIKEVKEFASKLFGHVEYGFISIPSYPCGTIGLICCCKDATIKCSEPCRPPPPSILSACKYYNEEIHKASFVLPTFVRKALE